MSEKVKTRKKRKRPRVRRTRVGRVVYDRPIHVFKAPDLVRMAPSIKDYYLKQDGIFIKLNNLFNALDYLINHNKDGSKDEDSDYHGWAMMLEEWTLTLIKEYKYVSSKDSQSGIEDLIYLARRILLALGVELK